MIRGATIICVSAIDWSFNWQQPQEVASRFAEQGNRVLFIENTGVRRPFLRDVTRLWARFANWLRASGAPRHTNAGLDVLSPLLLPFPYSSLARRINAPLLLHKVRRWIGKRDAGPLILFTFLPTPLVHSLVTGLDPDLVVYYCIDRLAESSPQASRLRVPEEELLTTAGLVLTTSEDLHERALAFTSRVEALPCGVRCRDFEEARVSRAPRPSLFGRRSGPVVGFIGTLRKELDLALIAAAARLAPDLHFAFVGPIMTNVRRLHALPNVSIAGPVPHTEVPNYMAWSDVGVLPYVMNDFTSAIMPAKLKEYLAAGLPIVGTSLPDVRKFASEHPGTVAIADEPAAFVAALRTAIATNSREEEQRRMNIARAYDWDVQMELIEEYIKRVL